MLDADLASDCRIRAFELAHPERFLESGIAEQDMVSMAAGLARQGLLPVVNSFASFLASRANEQIYNQASERTKVDLCAPLRRPDTGRAREVAPEHPRRLAARPRCRTWSSCSRRTRRKHAPFCAGPSRRRRRASRCDLRSGRRRGASSCRRRRCARVRHRRARGLRRRHVRVRAGDAARGAVGRRASSVTACTS